MSTSSSNSAISSSPFQSVKKSSSKPGYESVRRSLSNISLSSRCSYDNINENPDDNHQPLPYYPNNNNTNNSKQIKRNNFNENFHQADTQSTTSAITLRTDSYRQAHPLQSFAFDYPKRSLLSQTIENNNRRKTNETKHYEISV